MTDLPPLADTAVVLGAHVDDWRAAVREVGRALMRSASSSRSSSGRNADAAAFSWKVSKSSRS